MVSRGRTQGGGGTTGGAHWGRGHKLRSPVTSTLPRHWGVAFFHVMPHSVVPPCVMPPCHASIHYVHLLTTCVPSKHLLFLRCLNLHHLRYVHHLP